MNLHEIMGLVAGRLLTPHADLAREVRGAGAADLMSDVLACVQPEAVLLTGLCHSQVVRTALVADVAAVVFARGKVPDAETVALADRDSIPLISSPLGMFELCGRLYRAGLPNLEQALALRPGE
jgi:predicted transcriptional regulator